MTQAIPSTPLAIPSPIATSLGHSSSGNSVVSAAASQAIAATQGRRSAGMKASYEALQQMSQTSDVGVSSLSSSLSLATGDVRDSASNATVLASTTQTTKKQKK